MLSFNGSIFGTSNSSSIIAISIIGVRKAPWNFGSCPSGSPLLFQWVVSCSGR